MILGVWLYGTLKMMPPASAQAVVPVRREQPTLEMARDVIRNYFEAASDEDRIDLIHEKERVGAEWRDFYHRRSKPFPVLDSIQTGELVAHGGRTLAFFMVEVSPGGRRPLALYWEGDRFTLDWESHVAYGTMDWIEWLETRPVQPQVLRVYLSETHFGSQWAKERLVAVEHPDSLKPEVASVPETIDFSIDFTGRQRVPVTAEFRFEGPPQSPRVVLSRLIQEGWSR